MNIITVIDCGGGGRGGGRGGDYGAGSAGTTVSVVTLTGEATRVVSTGGIDVAVVGTCSALVDVVTGRAATLNAAAALTVPIVALAREATGVVGTGGIGVAVVGACGAIVENDFDVVDVVDCVGGAATDIVRSAATDIV